MAEIVPIFNGVGRNVKFRYETGRRKEKAHPKQGAGFSDIPYCYGRTILPSF
ncbi:hypothetical protein [Parasphingorhabdus sp.]|uniref:hypothetical protein n=1 Tax=Parasphingorhabdus sp. TaxID=2709688 RepID=UPI0032999B4D